jgi:broad specificity phosphatase PhoE
MNIKSIVIVLSFACALLPSYSHSIDEQPTTVFLIRHAEPNYIEKCDPSDCNPDEGPGCPNNPCLSDKGRTRSEQLVQVLKKANIEAIYSTNTHRTQETAKPLSETLSLSLTPYLDVAEIANKLQIDHIGQRILVVSHSGMVEAIIGSLNGDTDACIIGNEFDNLCVVTFYNEGNTEVVNLQYGEPSNGDADLTVTSLTHSPTNPTTTDLITFAAVVKNIGNERAGPSTLSFRVGGETFPQMIDIPALTPNETLTAERKLRLSVARHYRNTAIADVDNHVLEMDENNNQRIDNYTVTVSKICNDGDERFVKCWVGGRLGFRRDICVRGIWVFGRCRSGVIP